MLGLQHKPIWSHAALYLIRVRMFTFPRERKLSTLPFLTQYIATHPSNLEDRYLFSKIHMVSSTLLNFSMRVS